VQDIFLFSKKVRNGSGAHPNLLFKVYQGSYTTVKRQGHEVNHSPPPSADVRSEWSYTSAPNASLHGVVKKRFTYNFTSETYISKATTLGLA
jgi:hypothetical protein